MDILNFKKKTFQYYKDHVKGNENISIDQARRKMTRNMLLAKKTDSTDYHGQMYQYGRLWFVVNKNKIVWMKNYRWIPSCWKLDKRKYIELNCKLDIEDDSTYISLLLKEVRYSIKGLMRTIKERFKS